MARIITMTIRIEGHIDSCSGTHFRDMVVREFVFCPQKGSLRTDEGFAEWDNREVWDSKSKAVNG